MEEKRRNRGQGGNSSQKYATGKHKAKLGSAEWAKKRTRSIQRMMSRNGDIPANLRNDMERELAAHKSTINEKTFQRRRSAMISKYHMVRFFVDEAYTMHHPHAETYISLYGTIKKDDDEDATEEEKKTAAAKAALAAERPPMWKVVESTMEEGPDALRQLRERRSATGDDEASAPQPRSRDSRPAPRKERMANVIAKQNQSKNASKPTGDRKAAPASAGEQQSGGKTGGLNRRERRRIMRETMASTDKEDDEGGFFEL
ncbi:rRNA-processing protein efg-1 [Beauveria bassiana D1-5]|uniref:rRNA-processing protein EFG1 n=1 Tax=Beauveria bassiana D1-5 TaxID=1245745 RepID=A0A0A2WI82_BEABA|nr:rRNA-processing protein efg-1 [Beauveria bassiana D1-5]